MTKKINMHSAQQIAKLIREKRISRGLTLMELGGACGVHHSQLSRIEQGKVVFVSKNMEKICTFLQITPDVLDKEKGFPLISRVERIIASSKASERAIESLVTALEELTESQARNKQ